MCFSINHEFHAFQRGIKDITEILNLFCKLSLTNVCMGNRLRYSEVYDS